MITVEKIKRGGSKLEITREVLEAGLDIPVPVSAWRYYGDDLAPLVNAFQRMQKPVIVRGSHQNDYHGFIDVVPTIRDVNTLTELEKAVRIIERKMEREEVKAHCDDWQQPYSPEVHILMQEQSPSPINGGMLRHPHKLAGYFVQYRDLTDNGPYRFLCSYAIQGLERGEFYSGGLDKRPDEEIRNALAMFQKLESSEIFEKEWAYQIEFGLNPLLFFQARPFKKLQPEEKFEIPRMGNELKILEGNVFVITPPEGLELDFLICENDDLQYNVEKVNQARARIDGKGGLIQRRKFALGESSSISLKLGELTCFCSPCECFDFLFHSNYRFMKKSEVSFVDFHTNLEYPTSTYYDFRDFKRSRVISNGNRGVILPIK